LEIESALVDFANRERKCMLEDGTDTCVFVVEGHDKISHLRCVRAPETVPQDVCASSSQRKPTTDEETQSFDEHYKDAQATVDSLACTQFKQEQLRNKLIEAQENLHALRESKREIKRRKHTCAIQHNKSFKEENLADTTTQLHRQQEKVKRQEGKLLVAVMREKMLRARLGGTNLRTDTTLL